MLPGCLEESRLNLFACDLFPIILGCGLAYFFMLFLQFLLFLQFHHIFPFSLLLWQHKRATTLLFKCVLGGFVVSLILPTNKFFMLVGKYKGSNRYPQEDKGPVLFFEERFPLKYANLQISSYFPQLFEAFCKVSSIFSLRKPKIPTILSSCRMKTGNPKGWGSGRGGRCFPPELRLVLQENTPALSAA